MNTIYIEIPCVSPGRLIPLSDTDKVRINVTVFPMQKQCDVIVPARELLQLNRQWDIFGIQGKIESVLISVRKKDFLRGNPLIGTVKFTMDDCPPNMVHEMTLDIKNRHETVDGGQMRVRFHWSTNGAKAFQAPKASAPMAMYNNRY